MYRSDPPRGPHTIESLRMMRIGRPWRPVDPRQSMSRVSLPGLALSAVVVVAALLALLALDSGGSEPGQYESPPETDAIMRLSEARGRGQGPPGLLGGRAPPRRSSLQPAPSASPAGPASGPAPRRRTGAGRRSGARRVNARHSPGYVAPRRRPQPLATQGVAARQLAPGALRARRQTGPATPVNTSPPASGGTDTAALVPIADPGGTATGTGTAAAPATA